MNQKWTKFFFSISILIIAAVILIGFNTGTARAATYDCTSQSQIPEAECGFLVDLYNSTDGDNWTDNTNWLLTTSPCTWEGIHCVAGYNIDEITLGMNNLTGTIPTSINDLTYLETFSLYSNNISGSLPIEISSLPYLTTLSLWGNQLGGSIPSEFGAINTLELLVLSDNQLTGSIPSSLGSLSNLTSLKVDENLLSGALPEEIGDMSSLLTLDIEDNTNLTGALPSTLTSLSLNSLKYVGTNFCTPQDPDFQTWLSGISTVTKPSIKCPYLATLESPSGKIFETDPTYEWQWDNGAADEYRLYVSGPSGVVFNEWLADSSVCTGNDCSYTIGEDLALGNHTWYIQTRNSIATGPWTEGMEFRTSIPEPLTPNTTITDVTPTYVWDEWEGADNYRLFVSHASVGTVINEWYTDSICSGDTCSVTANTHLRTGNHAFTFQAQSDDGTTVNEWSTYQSFKLLNSTPPDGTITPTSPTGGEFTTTAPEYSWIAVERASWYKVYVGSQTTGKVYNQYHRAADVCYGIVCNMTPVKYMISGGDSPTLDPGTEHNWFVMPVNVGGNGSWSDPQNFRTEAGP